MSDSARDKQLRNELTTPSSGKPRQLFTISDDQVGAVAESVARFLGTGKYLAYQTIFVIIWVAFNLAAIHWRFDPYPFILLNLAFSTQAAYAAPLILLAQNRQERREHLHVVEDRQRAAETKADTEFLAREIAGIRHQVSDVVTRDYLRRELEELRDALDRISQQLDDNQHAHMPLRDSALGPHPEHTPRA